MASLGMALTLVRGPRQRLAPLLLLSAGNRDDLPEIETNLPKVKTTLPEMETNLPEIKYQSHEMRDYFLYFDHLFTWVGLSYKAKFTQFDHLVSQSRTSFLPKMYE